MSNLIKTDDLLLLINKYQIYVLLGYIEEVH